jgi:hypothetical protein
MMRGLRKRDTKALQARPIDAEREKTEGRREGGFALAMVLFITTLLAILGATTLIMAAYTMVNARSSMPATKAFDVAEAGISAGHSQIVTSNVQASHTYTDMMGGTCVVEIAGTTPNFTITSTGTYVQEGQTYRRKIEEQVSYEGSNGLSFLQNYILFAGRDVNISISDFVNFTIPITINGNMRAQRNVNIDSNPGISIGDCLIVNGNVEGKGAVNITSRCKYAGYSSQKYNGNIQSNGTVTLHAVKQSWWLLFFEIVGRGRIYTYPANNIKCGSLSLIPDSDGQGLYINSVNTQGWHSLPEVYLPEPDFEYYKSIAKQQGNYYVGNKSFTGNLGSISTSSISVYYATGDISMAGDFKFDQPNMTGIFVCEGNFNATSAKLWFSENSKFQAVAKGDCNFDCEWDFFTFGGTSDQFFFSAGNDANINMGMFSGLKLSVNAQRDINLVSNNIFSTPVVNPNPSFAVDVRGWPIDLTVRSWKELPTE